MKSNYDNYNLFDHTDEHLTRPKFKASRSKHFYPSEASVKVTDEFDDIITYGGCLRAAYFRLNDEFTGAPYEARTEYIFAQGKLIEEYLVNIWKEMGVWVANNIKFMDEENNISGELDVILSEPPNGQLYIGEVKTFYGYHAKKELFGNFKTKGFPKMSQLLQLLIYLNFFKDKGLPYGRLIYFARDSVDRKTFKVELQENGDKTYPKVDGEIVTSFTIQDVIGRYKELQEYLLHNTIPPNDFELQYSDEKIEDFYKKGKVGKTKYTDWKNKKLKKYEYIGDWNCRYCKFKEICWGK